MIINTPVICPFASFVPGTAGKDRKQMARFGELRSAFPGIRRRHPAAFFADTPIIGCHLRQPYG